MNRPMVLSKRPHWTLKKTFPYKLSQWDQGTGSDEDDETLEMIDDEEDKD